MDRDRSSLEAPRSRSSKMRILRWVIAGVVVLALLLASFWVPVPFLYAYLPGPVRDVGQLVEVKEAETYSSEGQLLLTTVGVDIDVTATEAVAAFVDSQKALVLESQVTGGASLEELQDMQEEEMDTSKQHARAVALSALGYGKPKGNGARVEATAGGAPADGVLLPGDVIVAIDDDPVRTTCEAGTAIASFGIGDLLSVRVRRDGRRRDLELRAVSDPTDPSTPYLGVAMSDVNYSYDPGVEVDFDTGRIAGPSAGLMFSLALYDRLTSRDLTGGRTIAGTGTIDCDGGVGPIGGVEQKVAGAEREGAEIFLAPAANAEAAERAARDIEVVSISSFSDAVDYLKGLE